MDETPKLNGFAADLHAAVADAPIICPHGHCDPRWFAENEAFASPADLIIIPDHYVFRMLYSQGVPLAKLGVGVPVAERDPRAIWHVFVQHWHLFLGTPSRLWLTHMFRHGFGITDALTPQTADATYDRIADQLADPAFRPRALFERFGIEILATTDAATDPLTFHHAIAQSDWSGRVIPTFRPDAVIDPLHPDFATALTDLDGLDGSGLGSGFSGYLDALRRRRNFFKSLGATATDHAIDILQTGWLDRSDVEALYSKARQGKLTEIEARQFHGHMLIEMAQMSSEDGLVMQVHAGSKRNTNAALLAEIGRDVGADIPLRTDWVGGLQALLDRVGTMLNFDMIAFTMDETTYARELAPMAGHWPCLKIGPPWWFHDSANGIARYFDQVVETAGYYNLAGFNDDTRAFMSIPARHDLWRRAAASHLATQVSSGKLLRGDAKMLMQHLAVDAARRAYKFGGS